MSRLIAPHIQTEQIQVFGIAGKDHQNSDHGECNERTQQKCYIFCIQNHIQKCEQGGIYTSKYEASPDALKDLNAVPSQQPTAHQSGQEIGVIEKNVFRQRHQQLKNNYL